MTVRITVRGFYLALLASMIGVSVVTLIGIVELNNIIITQMGGSELLSIVIDIVLYGPQIPIYLILFHYYNKNRYRLDVLKH